MRGEIDHQLAAGRGREPLLDLRGMAVAGDAISVNALRYLAKEAPLAGGAPCPADPGFGVDDDVVGIDQLRPQQRDQR
jgi:hypothetical protein